MSDTGVEAKDLSSGAIYRESQPIPMDTWEEVRAVHLNTPYSELLQAFLDQSKKWKTEPRSYVDQEEWKAAIAKQIVAANEMVQG